MKENHSISMDERNKRKADEECELEIKKKSKNF